MNLLIRKLAFSLHKHNNYHCHSKRSACPTMEERIFPLEALTAMCEFADSQNRKYTLCHYSRASRASAFE